ncbi:uncharacterized protein LOC142992885 [Genypterus blacodes]|uniref:uncharacterized protein LOC142992885 n=1 Tax=Genypterus blacodes TaxID=154954 RepID=UPI003F762F9F
MLSEGFLSVLPYTGERNPAAKPHTTHTQAHRRDPFNVVFSGSNVSLRPTESGPDQEELSPTQTHGPRVLSPSVVGLSIPGSSPVLQLDAGHSLGLDNFSFLQQYPDVQVCDLGRIPYSPSGISVQLRSFSAPQHQPGHGAQHQPQSSPAPDQGYLVMGGGVNISLDLPGSGLEPMSNSVLNGLLEKQLDEVYLQHLTDNLARCNSYLGNSLLHGLVPPPQPGRPQQGPDSLEAGLDDGPAGEGQQKISYLNTHNLGPCSSNFSSPVLRISEAVNVHME